MLAYILALAVGLGSLGIFLAAFFLPELHRKNDILWSGVGLFYALVLWVCAGRITGGVLLGQLASVALLGWAVSQTLSLRRELTPAGQKTPIPDSLQGGSLGSRVQGFVQGVKSKLPGGKATPSTPVSPPVPTVETQAGAVTETIVITPQTSDSTPEMVEISSEPVSPAPEVAVAEEAVVPDGVAEELPGMESEASSTSIEAVTAVISDGVTEELPGMESEASATSIEAFTEAIVETLQNEAISETSQETPQPETPEDVIPEPVPPHPPTPELVEAAVADAEEKHLPSDPPPTTEEIEAETADKTDSPSKTLRERTDDDDDWV